MTDTEKYVKDTFPNGKCVFCGRSVINHLSKWSKDGETGYLLQSCVFCGCDGTERMPVKFGVFRPNIETNKWEDTRYELSSEIIKPNHNWIDIDDFIELVSQAGSVSTKKSK